MSTTYIGLSAGRLTLRLIGEGAVLPGEGEDTVPEGQVALVIEDEPGGYAAIVVGELDQIRDLAYGGLTLPLPRPAAAIPVQPEVEA